MPIWPYPEGSIGRTIKGELGQLQSFIGRRQIGRPFLDAEFQLRMGCVKRLLRQLALGDVCDHPLHATHLPLADNWSGRTPYPTHLSRLGKHPTFAWLRLLPNRPLKTLHHRLQIIRMQEFEKRAADKLSRSVTAQRFD